jgi:hypothetical protein
MGRGLVAKPGKAPRGWLRAILGPPLALAFGANRWWIEPLFHRRMQRDLADELRAALAFLFQEREGRIIERRSRPDGYSQSADVATAADGLILYFWRLANPDEYGVRAQVAPAHVPNDAQDLPFALMTIDPETPVNRHGWTSLSTVTVHLKSGYDSLKLSFSPENFETTKQRIRHLEIYGNVLRT